MGKVCLHLAENRGDEDHPFAFLATYAVRADAGGRVQHRPLAKALEESSARRGRQELLHLLVPLQRAAEQVPWLAELVDSGAVYEAMAWTPAEAHRFLHAIPAFEAAGLVVRMPDSWRAKRPPRPEVAVRVGDKKPSALGMDAPLNFSVGDALGDETLTAAEVRQLLAGAGGLVRLRGQWVELDRDRLREVLSHWERVRREAEPGGLSFLEGMRLLVGAGRSEDEAATLAAAEGWSRVEAGAWLARTLAGVRVVAAPGGLPGRRHGAGQDDQVLTLLLLRRRRARGGEPRSLLVVPASLLANWQAEIERFAPSLTALIAHPSAMPARELADLPDFAGTDLVITTYGTLARTQALLRATGRWSCSTRRRPSRTRARARRRRSRR